MYIKNFYTGLLAAGILLIAGCKKDKAAETTVFVSTSDVTEITSETAKAIGDVDLVGVEDITERGFVWATSAMPTTANEKVAAGSGKGNFSGQVTGLTSGNTYYLRAYVINQGEVYYGNQVQFDASTPLELIINGDFALPDDGVKYNLITDIPNWKSDETSEGLNGREYDYWRGSGAAYVNDWGKSIYQVVGDVPSSKSDYAISFDANWSWTDWGDYDPTIVVTFSAFTGDDPTTRTVIGTKVFANGYFPGWQDNWTKKTGTFSIPAGSPFTGQKLVIEFDVPTYDDGSSGWDPNMWFNFDNVSVIQTLK
ncbi:hypothetical protein [Flavihumibacter solisilvae]|uniref:Uncharacterized protein n=1 Tax=Flavihumibacter solisilvae TaxID=1349421 RepID=A0A0C1LG50_9BACT|nr:hypothetical protein [Flavihumibacter solisilvae]KIC94333.1 hypothetical protein OI18_11945 [Flavihumibacter solisilvae]